MARRVLEHSQVDDASDSQFKNTGGRGDDTDGDIDYRLTGAFLFLIFCYLQDFCS